MIKQIIGLFVIMIFMTKISASSEDTVFSRAFTEANFRRVPMPRGVTLGNSGEILRKLSIGDVSSTQVHLGGREWVMTPHHTDDLQAVLDSEAGIRITLTDPFLMRPFFQVDSEGYLQYTVFFVSNVPIDSREKRDDYEGPGFNTKSISFHVTTRLSEAEEANPLITACRMRMSFGESIAFISRHGKAEYLNYLLENGYMGFLQYFMLPNKQADYAKCLAAEKKRLLEAGKR